MRWLLGWVLGTFLSIPGIIVLAALDASPFLWLPFGLDAAVVVLTARSDGMWVLLIPVFATIGSLAGGAVSYWIGRKGGERGLERFVPAERLRRLRQRLGKRGPIGTALLAFIPPPFPVTAVMLAAGALGVKRNLFFAALAVVRLVRFAVLAWLATLFGQRILGWIESPVVSAIAITFIAFAAVVTVVGLVKLVRHAPRRAAMPA